MDWQLHSGRHRGEGRRCFSAFWRLAGLLLALTLAAAFPSVAAALVLERPPYLQLGTQTSMVVRWRTDIPSESRLRYGPAPEQLDALIDIPGTRTEHEIEITGLTPDTVYYYAVGTPTQNLEGGDADHFFRTSPPTNTGQRFRIWVVGDSGTANGSAAAVRDAYLGFAGADRAAVWVMLGDNAYSNGTDAEYTAAVFQMYPQILRNTVLWPSPGNHDFRTSVAATQSGPYFETFTLPKEGEAGGAPSGTEAYYSFDYGNVHFIAIDSDGTPRDAGAPMYSWLELDLQGNDKDFVIAYWHHPPYSKGSHD
ncbi:MAG: metallophosphoesterase family protein, partial [Myxococcota bacterium]